MSLYFPLRSIRLQKPKGRLNLAAGGGAEGREVRF